MLENPMDSFADRLRLAVGEQWGAISAFATRAGIKESSLRKYLKGDVSPGMDKVYDFAVAGGVRPEWLFTGELPMRPTEGGISPGENREAPGTDLTSWLNPSTDVHLPEELQEWLAARGIRVPAYNLKSLLDPGGADVDLVEGPAVDDFDLDDYTPIPRRDVMAAAGDQILIPGEEVVDYVLFKTEFLRGDLGLDPRNLTVIQAKGDSMEPTIRSGDLLLLDMSQAYEGDNAVYVLNIDGRILVKRLAFRLDGTIEVKSDNDRYAPELVKRDGNDHFRIVARVVWKGGRM